MRKIPLTRVYSWTKYRFWFWYSPFLCCSVWWFYMEMVVVITKPIFKIRNPAMSEYCIGLFCSLFLCLCIRISTLPPSYIFCVSPRSELGFPTPYSVLCFMLNELRWYVIVCFVDIDGIVELHCLNFCIVIKR